MKVHTWKEGVVSLVQLHVCMKALYFN